MSFVREDPTPGTPFLRSECTGQCQGVTGMTAHSHSHNHGHAHGHSHSHTSTTETEFLKPRAPPPRVKTPEVTLSFPTPAHQPTSILIKETHTPPTPRTRRVTSRESQSTVAAPPTPEVAERLQKTLDLENPRRTDYTYSASATYKVKPPTPDWENPRMSRRGLHGKPTFTVTSPSALTFTHFLKDWYSSLWSGSRETTTETETTETEVRTRSSNSRASNGTHSLPNGTPSSSHHSSKAKRAGGGEIEVIELSSDENENSEDEGEVETKTVASESSAPLGSYVSRFIQSALSIGLWPHQESQRQAWSLRNAANNSEITTTTTVTTTEDTTLHKHQTRLRSGKTDGLLPEEADEEEEEGTRHRMRICGYCPLILCLFFTLALIAALASSDEAAKAGNSTLSYLTPLPGLALERSQSAVGMGRDAVVSGVGMGRDAIVTGAGMGRDAIVTGAGMGRDAIVTGAGMGRDALGVGVGYGRDAAVASSSAFLAGLVWIRDVAGAGWETVSHYGHSHVAIPTSSPAPAEQTIVHKWEKAPEPEVRADEMAALSAKVVDLEARLGAIGTRCCQDPPDLSAFVTKDELNGVREEVSSVETRLAAAIAETEARLTAAIKELRVALAAVAANAAADTEEPVVAASVEDNADIIALKQEVAGMMLALSKLSLETSDLRLTVQSLEATVETHANAPPPEKVIEKEVVREVVGGGLDTEEVNRLVALALATYDADKTARPDFALESAGGSVISIRCSESYNARTRQESVLGIPLWYSVYSPRVAIQPGIVPGECWAFKGASGFLVVKLSGWIDVDGVSLEHIPKSVSPDGHIESAPKDFQIWGLDSETEGDGKKLGDFTYDDEGEPLQYFPIKVQRKGGFPMVELKIQTNHGHPVYTCLYRLRVHGTRVKPAYGSP